MCELCSDHQHDVNAKSKHKRSGMRAEGSESIVKRTVFALGQRTEYSFCAPEVFSRRLGERGRHGNGLVEALLNTYRSECGCVDEPCVG